MGAQSRPALHLIRPEIKPTTTKKKNTSQIFNYFAMQLYIPWRGLLYVNLKASCTDACEWKLNESLVFCRRRWEAWTLRSLPLDFYQDEQTNGSFWPTSKEEREPLGATEIRWKAKESPSVSNINWFQITYPPTPPKHTHTHTENITKTQQKANWRCTSLYNLSARPFASS